METSQIFTLITLGILVFIGYLGVSYRLNYEKSGLSGLFFLLLPVSIALLALILLGSSLNDKIDLEKQLKNKCPEYEKIENVYKLKI